MSFTLLAPWGLLGLLAVPALILLHLLQRRRIDVTVATLAFFRRLAEDGVGPAPQSERARRRLPLALIGRIVFASCVSLLIARPALVQPRPVPSVRLVAILDRSASTGAIYASGRSRYDAIVAELERCLDTLTPEDTVTLVEAPGGRVLHRGSPAAVAAAIPRAPGVHPDDWLSTIASARAVTAPDARTRGDVGPMDTAPDALLLFSDHVPGDVAAAGIPVVARGRPVVNAGIVAAEPAPAVEGTTRLFVAVRATDDVAALDLERAGVLVQHVDDASGVLAGATVELESGTTTRLAVRTAGDALPLDDELVWSDGAGSDAPILVRLTGAPDPNLRHVLALLPGAGGLAVSVLDADDTTRAPDVEILSGTAEAGEPPAALRIYVDPPAGELAGGWRIGAGPWRPEALRDGERRLDGLGSLTGIAVREASPLVGPAGSGSIVLSASGADRVERPLIAWIDNDVALVIAFDPSASTWPLQPSWPVFWASLFEQRFGARVGPSVIACGAPIRWPAAPAHGTAGDVATLIAPSGRRTSLPADAGWWTFDTNEIGLHRLVPPAGSPERLFPVALLSAAETLCPADERPFAAATDLPARRASGASSRPDELLFRWSVALCAALALGLAVLGDRRPAWARVRTSTVSAVPLH